MLIILIYSFLWSKIKKKNLCAWKQLSIYSKTFANSILVRDNRTSSLKPALRQSSPWSRHGQLISRRRSLLICPDIHSLILTARSLHMCRGIRLLARSIHVHIRRWHIRTVSGLSIIRWGSRRRGRVWGRHKHWAGIVCQYRRRGVILTMRQWYWRWIVPHVPVHVRTAAWELVWRRTWFFWFVDFWWRRNWPWWRFFFEFSFVFRCFVQLATLGSSVFKPHLKQDNYKARISVNKCSIVSLKDSSVYLLCKTISKIND